jgi:hypothetical protein
MSLKMGQNDKTILRKYQPKDHEQVKLFRTLLFLDITCCTNKKIM